MISVVIPTIPGREHWLERNLAAYERTTDHYEVLIVRDQPSCGAAWKEGVRRATGDFIHLSNDDVEPLGGWWQTAVMMVAMGKLPCPRVVNTDGTLQSCGNTDREARTGARADVARIPFLPAAMKPALADMPDTHYMVDYWITARGLELGRPTVVNRRYAFIHHMASEGRRTE